MPASPGSTSTDGNKDWRPATSAASAECPRAGGRHATRRTFSRRFGAAADVSSWQMTHVVTRTALATYPCVRSLPGALSAGPCEVGFRGVQEAPV